jgi:hypothetical protein
VLALITIVNLRGRLGGEPYLFGSDLPVHRELWRSAAVRGSEGADRRRQSYPERARRLVTTATGSVTIWLLLRAFASGCTAMTGVEAVGNGRARFKIRRLNTRIAH